MTAHKWHLSRFRWHGLALLLPLLYLYHVAPHSHDDHPFSQRHEAPAAHANHTHDHPGQGSGDADPSHHHHELSGHLDSHFLRLHERMPQTERDLGVLGPEISSRIVLSVTPAPCAGPEQRLPEPLPLLGTAPRAPPLRV